MSAYTAAMQQMQRLGDSIQTTANNQLFADQQLELGTKQVDMADKQLAVVDQQMDVVTGITDPLEKATHYLSADRQARKCLATAAMCRRAAVAAVVAAHVQRQRKNPQSHNTHNNGGPNQRFGATVS